VRPVGTTPAPVNGRLSLCVRHIRIIGTRHNESNHPPPVGNISLGRRSARYDTGQTIHIFDGTI